MTRVVRMFLPLARLAKCDEEEGGGRGHDLKLLRDKLKNVIQENYI